MDLSEHHCPRGHTTVPIYPYFSYIFGPVPLLKGVQIQEESLWSGLYALEISVWGLFVAIVIVGGVQAPSINAVPSFPFNCFLSLEVFTSGQLWMKCCRYGNSVSHLLGPLLPPCQMNHELLGHPLNSPGIITPWVLAITSILFF